MKENFLDNYTQNIVDFLCLSMISIHLNWNLPRLSSPERECTSCL